MMDLDGRIIELERQIDTTPPGDQRDTLEALHAELLDLLGELTDAD